IFPALSLLIVFRWICHDRSIFRPIVNAASICLFVAHSQSINKGTPINAILQAMELLKLVVLLEVIALVDSHQTVFIVMDVNLTMSGELLQQKYADLPAWPELKSASSAPYPNIIPINNLTLEVASFTLDAPDVDHHTRHGIMTEYKSRFYYTIQRMQEGICQFNPFRLPTTELRTANGRDVYAALHTTDAFKKYFANHLTLDGYLPDFDHQPKVLLAQLTRQSPSLLTTRSIKLTPAYIQYRPSLSMYICDGKGTVRAACKRWTNVGEQICGQKPWWDL
ncbi:hypothetical protein PMAYCL1PPCAC_26214, partial [Pristionchus mayeri]